MTTTITASVIHTHTHRGSAQPFDESSLLSLGLHIFPYILCIILLQVKQALSPYTSNPVVASEAKLEALYSAIPYPDKERYSNDHTYSWLNKHYDSYK